MPEPSRQKITFGEMREMGVRGLLIYCSDYRCSHWTAISGDRWPDSVRLSDIEPQFACRGCGQRGSDVRARYRGGAFPQFSAVPLPASRIGDAVRRPVETGQQKARGGAMLHRRQRHCRRNDQA
jgi:hypothetical protein